MAAGYGGQLATTRIGPVQVADPGSGRTRCRTGWGLQVDQRVRHPSAAAGTHPADRLWQPL